MTVRLADGSLIEPGGELAAGCPTRIHVGDTLIEIENADRGQPAADEILLQTIERAHRCRVPDRDSCASARRFAPVPRSWLAGSKRWSAFNGPRLRHPTSSPRRHGPSSS